jgi:hypothetical protein
MSQNSDLKLWLIVFTQTYIKAQESLHSVWEINIISRLQKALIPFTTKKACIDCHHFHYNDQQS